MVKENEGVKFDSSKSQVTKEREADPNIPQVWANRETNYYTRETALDFAIRSGQGLGWDDAHTLRVAKTYEDRLLNGWDEPKTD